MLLTYTWSMNHMDFLKVYDSWQAGSLLVLLVTLLYYQILVHGLLQENSKARIQMHEYLTYMQM